MKKNQFWKKIIDTSISTLRKDIEKLKENEKADTTSSLSSETISYFDDIEKLHDYGFLTTQSQPPEGTVGEKCKNREEYYDVFQKSYISFFALNSRHDEIVKMLKEIKKENKLFIFSWIGENDAHEGICVTGTHSKNLTKDRSYLLSQDPKPFFRLFTNYHNIYDDDNILSIIEQERLDLGQYLTIDDLEFIEDNCTWYFVVYDEYNSKSAITMLIDCLSKQTTTKEH